MSSPDPMSQDEVQAALREVDWSELAPRLQAYALRRLRAACPRGSGKRPNVQGMDEEDFVEMAIEKLLSGRRKWPRGVSLWQVLCGIISSDIYNAIRKAKEFADADVSDAIDDTVSDSLDEDSYGENRKQILESLKDDPEAKKVAEYIMDADHDDPKQLRPKAIAEALRIPVKKVNNIKRRLQRRLGFVSSGPIREGAAVTRKDGPTSTGGSENG